MRPFFLVLMVTSACLTAEAQNLGNLKYHNAIDNIASNSSVKIFIKEIFQKSRVHFELVDNFPTKDTLLKQLKLAFRPAIWFKADFDKNGYTDLLISGTRGYDEPSVICILDSGGNKFYPKFITHRSFQYPAIPILTSVENSPAILYYYAPEITFSDTLQPPIVTDTLVFKYGDFVEYNHSPKKP
jgi:hypothetical protein